MCPCRLVATVNLTNCNDVISARMTYRGTLTTARTAVATIVEVLDTSTTQGVANDAGQSITIQGQGYGLTTTSSYSLDFSGTGCTGSILDIEPTTRVDETQLVVDALDLRGCSSSIAVTLSYKGSETSAGAVDVATIVALTDTSDSQGLKAASGHTFTLTGQGFGVDAASSYVMVMEGDDCSNNGRNYTVDSRDSPTALTVARADPDEPDDRPPASICARIRADPHLCPRVAQRGPLLCDALWGAPSVLSHDFFTLPSSRLSADR